ncbi:MAG: hypothetical protein LBG92_01930, partial [Prevotellaceae bacterium]|nr:hypothetical protein [Prevotellaceae bacterium]
MRKQKHSVEWLAKQVKCVPSTLRRQLIGNCVKLNLLMDIATAMNTDFFVLCSQWLKMKKSCKNARIENYVKKQNEVDIGQHIKAHVKMSGISVAEFAKKIHRSRTDAYYLFMQKRINTELLKKVS